RTGSGMRSWMPGTTRWLTTGRLAPLDSVHRTLDIPLIDRGIPQVVTTRPRVGGEGIMGSPLGPVPLGVTPLTGGPLARAPRRGGPGGGGPLTATAPTRG